MIFDTSLYNIFVPPFILVGVAVLVACAVTWLAIPTIVKIARLKGLFDKPNGRSSHMNPTPRLGGIAVFAGIILSMVLFMGVALEHEVKYIISGLLILFFVGLKDDLIPLVPWKKLLGQVISVLMIVGPGDFHLASLHGFWGIGELPYFLSIGLTIFLFLFLINAFNLVDGIDGLASGIGILGSLFFGIIFWIGGNLAYTVLSFTLVASLLVFFRFNVFSKKNKIFLGDTGSMLIGMILAILSIRFMNSEFSMLHFQGYSLPAIMLAVLIVPIFDTVRVFTVRIHQGHSPFTADRNHLHHHMLALSGSHRSATANIIILNLLFIALSFGIGALPKDVAIPIVLITAFVLFNIPVLMRKSRDIRHRKAYSANVQKLLSQQKEQGMRVLERKTA